MSNLIKRTHYCGELRDTHVGQSVRLNGYVARTRNLGGVIFVWLRDRTGIVQITFPDSVSPAVWETAVSLRGEFVVGVVGTVAARTPENVNPDLPTGAIEVIVEDITLYAKAKTPPFYIEPDSDTNEELRLRYRYLDLRRPDLQGRIMLRHNVMQYTRKFFSDNGFIEVPTPLLMKSTPEGARDYLVPSRVNQGSFYALPQSPQLYKQLAIYAGFDRYFQIARCLRDEDLRADRQPEFDQIDVEMSFCDIEDILAINETFVKSLFKDILNIDVPTPFARMTYAEAMRRYGSDKPDVRYGLELHDVTAVMKGCGLGAFDTAAHIAAIVVPGGNATPRKTIDSFSEPVKQHGLGGVAWVALGETVRSSINKFLTPELTDSLKAAVGANDNDLILLVAHGEYDTCVVAAGALREYVAKITNAIPEGFAFLWVTDFPLLEYSEEDDRYYAKHHPFTRPNDEDIPLMESNPGAVRALAYDMILNGFEVAGGSIRINTPELQRKMFNTLGFTPEQAEEQFGFLMEAMSYGVPPHGGIAYGFDRLVMLMAGATNIREVIPFPKTQNASELMVASPSPVPQKLLDELGIQLKTDN